MDMTGIIESLPVVGPELAASSTPEHLSVILDGNRRWAGRHGCPVVDAYRTGAQRAIELAAACARRGIDFVTLWVLSREIFDDQ